MYIYISVSIFEGEYTGGDYMYVKMLSCTVGDSVRWCRTLSYANLVNRIHQPHVVCTPVQSRVRNTSVVVLVHML